MVSRIIRCIGPVFIFALLSPALAEAQIGDFVKNVKNEVTDAKEGVDGARDIQCEIAGKCGNITRAEHFMPELYETVAVTVLDGTRRFPSLGVQGIVKDAFESALVENGFLLAAAADAHTVQEMISQGNKRQWSDAELAQVKDLVQNIDATIVVEIRKLDRELCELDDGRRRGSLARVHLSVRWLNVDAGDVPWVGDHAAEVCDEGRGDAAGTEALQKVAKQLAGSLPEREAS